MITLLTLLACTGPATDDTAGATEPVDERITDAEIGEIPEGGWLWPGPEFTVEPGQDIMYCLAGTYDGDDVGLTKVWSYQGEYGHHLQLLGTSLSTVDLPDGEMFDCTKSSDLPMDDLEPIGMPTGGNREAVHTELPEGFAFKLDNRQRYILQSHYVNTGTEPILVKDEALLVGVPEDEVETWANMIVFNHMTFDLPAHQETTSTLDCTMSQDVNVLSVFGHMHEWGRTFSSDITTGGETREFYRVDQWEAAYRDTPPMDYYDEGAFTLRTGDTISTHCTWFNDTDEDMSFPHEMCTTGGVGYPLLNAYVCSDG